MFTATAPATLTGPCEVSEEGESEFLVPLAFLSSACDWLLAKVFWSPTLPSTFLLSSPSCSPPETLALAVDWLPEIALDRNAAVPPAV
ncbi:MAG: hypothetical protein ACM36A_01130, partial [Bacteroidota bacterium]